MIRKVLVLGALSLAGCGPGVAVEAAALQQALGAAPPAKTLPIQWQGQQTGYWCGPGSTRIALTARSSPPSQTTLASYLGTTTNGTNHIGLVAGALNHYLGVGFYGSAGISDPATSAQEAGLREELVGTLSNGYAMVGNVVSGWRPPGYPSGTIYHYVAIVGYDQDGARALIADPAAQCAAGSSWCNVPSTYWVTTHDLAVWIGGKGYTTSGLAPTGGGTAGNGTLIGAIYTGGASTNRVAGATVVVGGESVVTGADGIYRFELAPGTYTATVSKAGFGGASVTRAVTSGTQAWGSMEINPTAAATGTLKGKIYAAPDVNQPLSGAVVTAGSASITTGADGLYSFDLAPGAYAVGVTKAGFANGSAMRTVTAGQTIWGSVGLTSSVVADTEAPVLAIAAPAAESHVDLAVVAFSGTVTEVSEVKVAGAPVPVSGGKWSVEVKLQPGPNTLSVSAVDAAGNQATASVTVSFDAGVGGLVHLDGDEAGRISSALVTLSAASGAVLQATTDSAGAFSLEAAPGEWTLEVEASGYLTWRQAVRVPDDQRLSLKIALTPGVDEGGEQRDTLPVIPATPTEPEPQVMRGGCTAAGGPALLLLAVAWLRRARLRHALRQAR